EKKEVRLEIRPDMLETITADGSAVLEPGTYQIYVGGALPTQRSKVLGSSDFLMAEFELK
ncbi:MAG: hypothetical protein AAFU60_04365, partial [Bacteroidota bacterium]